MCVCAEIENIIHLPCILQRGYKFLLIYFGLADSPSVIQFPSYREIRVTVVQSRIPRTALQTMGNHARK